MTLLLVMAAFAGLAWPQLSFAAPIRMTSASASFSVQGAPGNQTYLYVGSGTEVNNGVTEHYSYISFSYQENWWTKVSGYANDLPTTLTLTKHQRSGTLVMEGTMLNQVTWQQVPFRLKVTFEDTGERALRSNAHYEYYVATGIIRVHQRGLSLRVGATAVLEVGGVSYTLKSSTAGWLSESARMERGG